MGKNLRISDDAVAKRLQKMLTLRAKVDVENAHVKLMKGNVKTGKTCWTVSMIPIADCYNCRECKNNCYDIRNDCIYPAVMEDRAKNSAIHRYDPDRYFREIGEGIKLNDVKLLRLNVGGDLGYDDFYRVARLAEENRECQILFFTKTYGDLNKFVSENIERYPDNYAFPPNVHPIVSRWIGTECENPYGIPESHVLWESGETTAPEYGAVYCGGNCSVCHISGEGCWTLRKGESVIFKAH